MWSPLLMCRLPCDHQETKAQPIPRYISHALSFNLGATWRTTGSPKIRNETPNPNARALKKLTIMKKGSWADEGSSPSGGQRMGPSTMAGTVTSRVTANTLSQALWVVRAPLGTSVDTFALLYVLLSYRNPRWVATTGNLS